jgi:hypothetical protein
VQQEEGRQEEKNRIECNKKKEGRKQAKASKTQESYIQLPPMKPNPKKENGIDEQKNRWVL